MLYNRPQYWPTGIACVHLADGARPFRQIKSCSNRPDGRGTMGLTIGGHGEHDRGAKAGWMGSGWSWHPWQCIGYRCVTLRRLPAVGVRGRA